MNSYRLLRFTEMSHKSPAKMMSDGDITLEEYEQIEEMKHNDRV